VSEELTAEDRALLAALAALEPGSTSTLASEPQAPRPGPGARAAAGPEAAGREADAAAGREADAAAGRPEPADGEAGATGNRPEAAGRQADASAGAASARENETAAAETLARLYQEALGLLPYALSPVAPRLETKRRLMAVAAAAAAPASQAAATVTPGSQAAPAATPRVLARPATLPPRPRPPRPAEPRGARRWPLALAAALILALLGTSGWLYRGLLEQGKAISSIAEQRNAAQQRADRAEGRLAQLTADVKNLRDNFSVVTSPAVEACTLRPVMSEMASARGILFVAADHQHWYMSLRGLPPAGSGKVYQLWFVADQGPVSAGTFSAEAGSPLEAGSEHMPAGTRAVRITLESGPGSASPGGPDVLRNADALHTL
jgi:hypothetical protein